PMADYQPSKRLILPPAICETAGPKQPQAIAGQRLIESEQASCALASSADRIESGRAETS
ncbi:MAG: hypothetical protein AAF561_14540, partial [Planctomycetota bacterium]